jgi:oligopeptide/dipeptide ABC transporter ATP-binding protein
VTEATPPSLEVAGLKVHYPIRGGIGGHRGEVVRAVDGVDLTLAPGETLGVVGESGSGKSSLARAVMRLAEPTAGSVRLEGADLLAMNRRELNRARKRLQMVFQDPFASLDPRMSVRAIVREPLVIHRIGSRADQWARVDSLLSDVGIPEFLRSRYPHELSGGQRQRVAIARALATAPKVIIADEPTSALDVSVQAQVINLLERLQAEFGVSYLLISHNIAVVRKMSDRIAVMYLGRVVELAESEAVVARPAHPYTAALVSVLKAPRRESGLRAGRIVLTGDIPSPRNPPPGCPFHTRCWLYRELNAPEACRSELPPLRSPGAGSGQVACHFSSEVRLRLKEPGSENARSTTVAPALSSGTQLTNDRRD